MTMDHGLVPQGIALYRAGKIDEAEASYRRALDAGDNSAYSMLAQLLVETGRSQEAEVVYQEAIAHGAKELLVEYGNLLADQDDRQQEAEQIYRWAMSIGDMNAYANAALLLDHAGRKDEALSLYRRGASLGDVIAKRNLGVLLGEMGHVVDAERELKEAIDQGDVMSLVSLGDLYLDIGLVVDAQACYRKAIAQNLDQARLHLSILLADEFMDVENARGQLEACERSGFDPPNIHYRLGLLLLDAGNLKDAESRLVAAITLGCDEARVEYAAILVSRHLFKEAEEQLGLAVNRGVEGAGAKFGRLLLLLGKYAEAESILRAAVEQDGEPQVTLGLVYVLEKQGKFDEAERVRRDARGGSE